LSIVGELAKPSMSQRAGGLVGTSYKLAPAGVRRGKLANEENAMFWVFCCELCKV